MIVYLFFVLFAAHAPEKCSLSGTVVDARTGEPLPKTQLILESPASSRIAAAITVTDGNGAFSMVGIAPGAYRLKAQRNGYLETYYGARRPGAAGTTFKLEPGSELKDLRLRLSRFGVIAGTIRDVDGEPLARIGVDIRRVRHRPLERYVMDEQDYGGRGVTDDLGQYRVANLPPGKYYVIARPTLWPVIVPDGTPRDARLEFAIPAVYPGSQDEASATPVEIMPGNVLTGIDIYLPRTRLFTIRGLVTNTTGLELGPIKVSFHKEGGRRPLVYAGGETNAKPGGEFEFRGVPPGAYELIARADAGGITYSGSAQVVVSGADVERVRVSVGRNAELVGSYRVEGQEKPTVGAVRDRRGKFDPGGVYFLLFQRESFAEAEVRLTDGALRAALLPGRYYLEIAVGSRGYYVKSAMSGSVDALIDGIAVPVSGSVPLEVVFAVGAAEVEGRVLDTDEKPVAGATVLLAPERRLSVQRFKSVTTDQNGRFRIQSVPPGSYKLFAWDDTEEGAWFDPEFLKKYEDKGQAITVRESEQTMATLHVL